MAKHKKPFVPLAVQAFALMWALSHFSMFARISSEPVSTQSAVGTLVVALLVILVSRVIFTGIDSRRFRSRLAVSLFLWGSVVEFPMMNIMRFSGYYLADPPLSGNQVLMAAVGDLLRYLIPLILIVWAGFSKKAKMYFASSSDPDLGDGSPG